MPWCCHHGRLTARVYPVHLMNVEVEQPTNLGREFVIACCCIHPPSPLIIITKACITVPIRFLRSGDRINHRLTGSMTVLTVTVRVFCS